MFARRVLLVLLVGCGARTSLEPAGDGPGAVAEGGGPASVPTSTASSTSSAGGGGEGGSAPLGCGTLVWAGEPVFVSASRRPPSRTTAATQPRLVALDATRVALVLREVGHDGASLASVAVDAWGDWPPVVPPPEPHLAMGAASRDAASVAVAEGAPGDGGVFTFATIAEDGGLVVGRATPGAPGSTFETSPGQGDVLRWLTSPGAPPGPMGEGRQLVGVGSASTLSVLAVGGGAAPDTLALLGCTDGRLASDAVRTADGRILVASANGAPFDDCQDPDVNQPPRVVQTVVIDGDGDVLPGSAARTSGSILDLQLASRPAGGAWIGWRTDGDAYAQIIPVAEDGSFVAAGLSYGLAPQTTITIAAHANGLALATLGTDAETGLGHLLVQILDGAFANLANTASSPVTPLRPPVAPDLALVVAPDERAFLVAFVHEAGTGPVVALLRADCAR